MVKVWQLLVCWVLLVGVAAGDNEIFGLSSHEPPDPPGFTIEQGQQTVTISLPGSYIFWAEDDADPDGLGQIKKIWVYRGDEHVSRSHSDVHGRVSWTSEYPLYSHVNPAADCAEINGFEG